MTVFGLPSPFASKPDALAAEETPPLTSLPALSAQPIGLAPTPALGSPSAADAPPLGARVDPDEAAAPADEPSPWGAFDAAATIMDLGASARAAIAAEQAEETSNRSTLFGQPAPRPTPLPAAVVRDEPQHVGQGEAPAVISSVMVSASLPAVQVEPRAAPTPAPAASVLRSSPPGSVAPASALSAESSGVRKAERRRRANDLYAAARFAAAVAEDEQERAIVRRRRLLMWLLAFVMLVIGAGAAYFTIFRTTFTAKLGELTVVRGEGRYDVSVGLHTSAAARISFPGGEQLVDGAATIAFPIDEREMTVGDNIIELTVGEVEGEERRSLTLHVMVYYRLNTPSQAVPKQGSPVTATLEVMPGWKVSVEGGEAVRVSDREVRLALDPEPLLAQVDHIETSRGALSFVLVVEGPDGDAHRFTEVVQLPLPLTPLAVWAPAYGWAQATDRVTVAGRTQAGATLKVGDIQVVAGADGLFSLSVPLAVGSTTLKIHADGQRQRPVELDLHVERLSTEAFAARREQSRRAERAFMAKASRAPRYAKLRSGAAKLKGRRVAFKGRIVSVRRMNVSTPKSADDGLDVIQLTTCNRGDGCPIWIELKGPMMASAGAKVRVAGVLDGVQTYQTSTGKAVAAPRLIQAMLVP